MVSHLQHGHSYSAPTAQNSGLGSKLAAPKATMPVAKCMLTEEVSCQPHIGLRAIPTPARSARDAGHQGCAFPLSSLPQGPHSPVSRCTPRGPPQTPRGASWVPPRITPQQSWKPVAQVVGVSDETFRLPVAPSHSWVPNPTPRCELGRPKSWIPPIAARHVDHVVQASALVASSPSYLPNNHGFNKTMPCNFEVERFQKVTNDCFPNSPTSKIAKPFSHCPSLVIDQRLEGSPLRACQTMIAGPNQESLLMRMPQQNAQHTGFPHCLSLVAPVYSAKCPKRQNDTLRIASAFNSRQHPAKMSTGIPNADAVLEGIDYLGIADGVSGVHALGLTPDALPWELLHSCGSGLFAAAAKGEPKEKSGKQVSETHSEWMIELIQEAFDSTEEHGATTLLLAAIKGSNLVTACLGDSGILILRPVSFYPLRLRPIFKTEPGRYDARRPVQIQRLHGCDAASAHEVISSANIATTPVKVGDLLVLGTDGLFDNLSDIDIQKALERCCATGSNEELAEASSFLVDLAIRSVRLGEDNADKPPWQRNAASVPANNADDTTALVAMIKADDDMSEPPTAMELCDASSLSSSLKRNGPIGASADMKLCRMDRHRRGNPRGGSHQRSFSAGASRQDRRDNCVIS